MEAGTTTLHNALVIASSTCTVFMLVGLSSDSEALREHPCSCLCSLCVLWEDCPCPHTAYNCGPAQTFLRSLGITARVTDSCRTEYGQQCFLRCHSEYGVAPKIECQSNMKWKATSLDSCTKTGIPHSNTLMFGVLYVGCMTLAVCMSVQS